METVAGTKFHEAKYLIALLIFDTFFDLEVGEEHSGRRKGGFHSLVISLPPSEVLLSG